LKGLVTAIDGGGGDAGGGEDFGRSRAAAGVADAAAAAVAPRERGGVGEGAESVGEGVAGVGGAIAAKTASKSERPFSASVDRDPSVSGEGSERFSCASSAFFASVLVLFALVQRVNLASREVTYALHIRMLTYADVCFTYTWHPEM
jgi:hypothetical protein